MFGQWFLSSKTIWGIVLMAAPQIFRLFGWDWDESYAPLLQKFFGYGSEVVGFILAVWGRAVANKPLVMTPAEAATPPPPEAATPRAPATNVKAGGPPKHR